MIVIAGVGAIDLPLISCMLFHVLETQVLNDSWCKFGIMDLLVSFAAYPPHTLCSYWMHSVRVTEQCTPSTPLRQYGSISSRNTVIARTGSEIDTTATTITQGPRKGNLFVKIHLKSIATEQTY